MKLTNKQAAAFLKEPDPSTRLVLFYGSDQGLIHERAQNLLKLRAQDPNDPFLVSHLIGTSIKKNPEELFNEAFAMSLVGGDRTIMIRLGNEDISKSIEECIKNEKCSVIIIEAGELGPKSPIRRLAEKNNHATAIPGYLDNPSGLSELIDSVLQDGGKSIDRESKNYMISNIGSDRMISRSELDKLVTYMGTKKEIKIGDVLAIIGDNGAFSIDNIIYPIASGNTLEVELNLERAFKEGQTPIAILRATMRHFQKLHLALGYIENGLTPRDALREIRPPILFLFVDEFLRQLKRWSISKVPRALTILNEAEIRCKTTGLPVNLICSRALMSLSQAARK